MSLLATVGTYFEHDGWLVHPGALEGYLQVSYRTASRWWHCCAQVVGEDSQFVFYSLAPCIVPTDRRPHVLEFLAKVNSGLATGEFAMERASGAVRFMTQGGVESGALSEGLWRSVVYNNLSLMEHYWPGLQAVACEGIRVDDALTIVEMAF